MRSFVFFFFFWVTTTTRAALVTQTFTQVGSLQRLTDGPPDYHTATITNTYDDNAHMSFDPTPSADQCNGEASPPLITVDKMSSPHRFPLIWATNYVGMQSFLDQLDNITHLKLTTHLTIAIDNPSINLVSAPNSFLAPSPVGWVLEGNQPWSGDVGDKYYSSVRDRTTFLDAVVFPDDYLTNLFSSQRSQRWEHTLTSEDPFLIPSGTNRFAEWSPASFWGVVISTYYSFSASYNLNVNLSINCLAIEVTGYEKTMTTQPPTERSTAAETTTIEQTTTSTTITTNQTTTMAPPQGVNQGGNEDNATITWVIVSVITCLVGMCFVTILVIVVRKHRRNKEFQRATRPIMMSSNPNYASTDNVGTPPIQFSGRSTRRDTVPPPLPMSLPPPLTSPKRKSVMKSHHATLPKFLTGFSYMPWNNTDSNLSCVLLNEDQARLFVWEDTTTPLWTGKYAQIYQGTYSPDANLVYPIAFKLWEESTHRLGAVMSPTNQKEVLMSMQTYRHDHVLRFYGMLWDSGNLDKQMYLGAFDLAEYGNLEFYLRNDDVRSRMGELFEPIDLTAIMLQVATGLEYLHAQNILHRTLDLECILLMASENDPSRLKAVLGRTESCRRLAWGNEKNRFHKRRPDSQMVEDGKEVVVTTLRNKYIDELNEVNVFYAAPEVLVEHVYSRTSDVWAFGMCVWRIFSNGQHHDEEFPEWLKEQWKTPDEGHVGVQSVVIDSLPDDCNVMIANIVSRAVSYDMNLRSIYTISEIRNDLRECLNNEIADSADLNPLHYELRKQLIDERKQDEGDEEEEHRTLKSFTKETMGHLAYVGMMDMSHLLDTEQTAMQERGVTYMWPGGYTGQERYTLIKTLIEGEFQTRRHASEEEPATKDSAYENFGVMMQQIEKAKQEDSTPHQVFHAPEQQQIPARYTYNPPE